MVVARPAHTRARHIALAFPVGLAHLQRVMQGIVEYARGHGRWLFTTSPEAVTLPIQSLRGWRGHGVIATLVNDAEARAAKQLRIPVVNFSGALPDAGLPRVMVNNPAVGRLAAAHLLACGFKRFGFYGLRNVKYSESRGGAFVQALEEQLGSGCCVAHLSPNSFTPSRPWQDEMERLEQWVARLQTPVGLFAANDQRARMLLDACQRLGLRVPDDAGVIGVDNDLVVCEFSDPPLSSIACDWYRIGTESAALLDRLMSGQGPPIEDLLIGPIGVVRRRSTDVLVVDDAGVGRALHYVREHLSEPFGVEAILREAGMSRRSLEQAFKRSVGCTPYSFVCRARVERAKELLVAPRRMKLTAIALACGFADLRRLRLVFCRYAGMTPAEYRRRHIKPDLSVSGRGPGTSAVSGPDLNRSARHPDAGPARESEST
jgi:LacI family transcriptional regulator